jgi:hypothetical protein
MLNVVMMSVVMLNVVVLSVIMLNVIMLNVFILNVVMLSVVMLNGVVLSVVVPRNATTYLPASTKLFFMRSSLLVSMFKKNTFFRHRVY